ncbi:MAG TPA: sodium/solute symporter [Candidatus Sulfotelmatobacter sp.]|nr:sodium/solute symporter [Candidatus Sulfotelmatobacter sp.]
MGFSLGIVDWCICFVVLGFSIFLGLYLSVRKKASLDSSHFFLADRSLTWPFVGASLFATNIGAEHLVGLSGDSYRYGLSAGAVELTTCITVGFAAAFLYPFYIRNRVFTTPEFLEKRYHPAARALFSALMLVISITTKMAFHLYAGALVLRGLTGWDVMTVVWIMGAVAAGVTIIGGFTAIAYTDSIQTGIIVLGCSLMAFTGLHHVGGWHSLVSKVPQAMHIAKPYDDPNYPFWGVILSAFYGGIFYWGVDQVNVQRVLGARNIDQARWGGMFTTFLKLFPVFIFALPGVIALALFPGRESKTTFVTLLNELLPTGLRGLVLAALLASLIGSTLSVMNSVSTLTVRDFILHFRPRTSERAQVFLGRLVIVIATFCGVAAAYAIYKTPDGLYKYLQTISIYLTMPVAPAIVFGILSKRVTVKGALVSVLLGCGLAALFVTDQLIGPAEGSRLFPWLHTKLTLNYSYRGLWGTILCVAVMFLVSSFTRKTDSAALEQLTVSWKLLPERFRGIFDWRLQLAVLSAITVVLYWVLR